MRKAAPTEARAFERAITTAQQERLAFLHPLDKLLFYASIWLDPESVRAKLTEQYVLDPDARYGLVFVPVKRPFIRTGAYHIAPIRAGTSLIPTLVIVLPAASIAVARRDATPVAALLRIEAPRLRAEHERTGLPMLPALAALFE